MKIHRNCKIELACSTDAGRYAISEPFLDIKNAQGTLVATTGTIMAIIPVLIATEDDAGYCAKQLLKDARKVNKLETTEIVLAGTSGKLLNGATALRAGEAKDSMFPNWRQVVPAPYEKPVLEVGIDAKLLWELAQAMGTVGVKLTFKDGVAAVQVAPIPSGVMSRGVIPSEPTARGVIMPIKFPENLPTVMPA